MNSQARPTPRLITITTTPVTSSRIQAIGYDVPTQTLQIDFTGNPQSVYQYAGMSPETFADFQKAESKGSFFHREVKDRLAFARFNRETGEVTKTWTPEAEEQTEGQAAA